MIPVIAMYSVVAPRRPESCRDWLPRSAASPLTNSTRAARMLDSTVKKLKKLTALNAPIRLLLTISPTMAAMVAAAKPNRANPRILSTLSPTPPRRPSPGWLEHNGAGEVAPRTRRPECRRIGRRRSA